MNDYIRSKSFQILKQPAYRISDMLKKTSNNSISSDTIRICLDYIKSFCKEVYKQNIMIFFVIDYDKFGGEDNFILRDNVMSHILKLSAKDHCIHYLDINANLLESIRIYDIHFNDVYIEENTVVPEDVTAISDLFDSTFIFSYGVRFETYHSGKLLEYKFLDGEQFIYGKISSKMKPISKYKEIIIDHYNSCVKLSQGIDYWHNKNNRILRNSPEDIFKKSLWSYIYYFSNDTIDVIQEYQLPSESKIDILARTSRDTTYIFEIKVLGRCLSLGDKKEYYTYSDERVHEGLIQTKQYIEQLSNVTRATVVVYDGRDEQVDICIPDEEKHIKLDEPLLLYLESDNATETATKIRKQIKSKTDS